MAKKAKKTVLTTQTHKERIRAQQEEARKKAAAIRRAVIGAAIALAVVVVGVFAVVLIQQSEKNQLMSSVTPPDATEDGTAIRVKASASSTATPTASDTATPAATDTATPSATPTAVEPLTVTAYFDYQCAGCVELETAMGPQLLELAASGDIVLDNIAMLGQDAARGNDTSTKAAIGAACADAIGGIEAYKSYHTDIFTQIKSAQELSTYSGLTDELMRDGIVSFQDDQLTSFQTCFDDKLTKGFVEGVADKASQAGITSTPALKVNGNDVDLANITDYTALASTDAATVLEWLKTFA
ncbi:MAG: DsbA family protein [Propionibacteriaceae bacterium]|nr:DsbA family protein [Propionibacteriaceae bacterium]